MVFNMYRTMHTHSAHTSCRTLAGQQPYIVQQLVPKALVAITYTSVSTFTVLVLYTNAHCMVIATVSC